MQAGNTNYICKNDLDKACFQHDMAYSKYTDFSKGTESDKVLIDKTFKIVSNPKYNGYERGLASMVTMSNQQLADELHKPIIRKFKTRMVYSSFIK